MLLNPHTTHVSDIEKQPTIAHEVSQRTNRRDVPDQSGEPHQQTDQSLAIHHTQDPLLMIIQFIVALLHTIAYNNILTTTITHTINHMSKSKSNRRPAKMYTLLDHTSREVSIDLNNYRCICNITGKRSQFHHAYLNGLIHRKYQGNIDLFRDTYVTVSANARQTRARDIQTRIDNLTSQLNKLIQQKNQLTSTATPIS